jgi:hypothetical protein
MYLSAQNKLTNNQWYHQFVTAANVAVSQGVERQHGVLRDYVAKQLHGVPYDQLTDSVQKDAVCKDAAERYLAFVFLSQSGEKHNQLRADLKNQFMSGHDNYPRTVQAMLRFLDNYDQQHSAVVAPIGEGATFAQKSTLHPGYNGKDYIPSFWKNRTCTRCKQRGHPPSHCPAEAPVPSKDAKVKATDATPVTASTPSTPNPTPPTSDSDAKSVASLSEEVKALRQSFAMLQERSVRSDSDSDSEQDIAFCQITGVPTGDPLLPFLADTSLNLRDVIILDSWQRQIVDRPLHSSNSRIPSGCLVLQEGRYQHHRSPQPHQTVSRPI